MKHPVLRHRLKTIDDLRASTDGSMVTMTLRTSTAPPLAVEFPSRELTDVVASLLQLAIASAASRGTSSAPGTTPMLPMHGMRLELHADPNGQPMLGLHAGEIALGFLLDRTKAEGLGRALLMVSASMDKPS